MCISECEIDQAEKKMLVNIRCSVLRLALVLLRCEVILLFTATSWETGRIVRAVVVVCVGVE